MKQSGYRYDAHAVDSAATRIVADIGGPTEEHWKDDPRNTAQAVLDIFIAAGVVGRHFGGKDLLLTPAMTSDEKRAFSRAWDARVATAPASALEPTVTTRSSLKAEMHMFEAKYYGHWLRIHISSTLASWH